MSEFKCTEKLVKELGMLTASPFVAHISISREVIIALLDEIHEAHLLIDELEKQLKLATDRTPKYIIHTEVVFGGTKATKSNASNSCFKIE